MLQILPLHSDSVKENNMDLVIKKISILIVTVCCTFLCSAQNVDFCAYTVNVSTIKTYNFEQKANHSKQVAWQDSTVRVMDKYRTVVNYSYNRDGLLINKKVSSSKDGEVYSVKFYYYSYMDNKCFKIVVEDGLKDEDSSKELRYYIYEGHRMTSSYIFFDYGRKKSLYNYNNYIYDSGGNLTDWYVYRQKRSDENLLVLKEQSHFTYNWNNQVATVTKTLRDMGATDFIVYSYDKQDRMNGMYDCRYAYAKLKGIDDDFNFNYIRLDEGTKETSNYAHFLNYDSEGLLDAVNRRGDGERAIYKYDSKGRLVSMRLHHSSEVTIYYGRNSKTESLKYLKLPVVQHNSLMTYNNKVFAYNPTLNIFIGDE